MEQAGAGRARSKVGDDARPIAPGLLDEATLARYEALRAELDQNTGGRALRILDLEVGQVGVLEATVVRVEPIRPFNRKRGGEGLRGAVTLSDHGAEVTLTLWDEQTRLVRDGTFAPGARVRLRGATVQAGFRGGLELALGSAVVERLTTVESPAARLQTSLRGQLVALSPARIVGEAPARIQADLTLRTATGPSNVALEGELVRQLRGVPVGTEIEVAPVAPHPLLDSWWLAGPGCALVAPRSVTDK